MFFDKMICGLVQKYPNQIVTLCLSGNTDKSNFVHQLVVAGQGVYRVVHKLRCKQEQIYILAKYKSDLISYVAQKFLVKNILCKKYFHDRYVTILNNSSPIYYTIFIS